MTRRMRFVSGLLCVLVLLGAAGIAPGATLVWDPVPGDVAGYKVYYGTVPGIYPYFVDVGPSTSQLLDNLLIRRGVRNYFSVTAYNNLGESAFSAPISWTPPLPPAVGVIYLLTGTP